MKKIGILFLFSALIITSSFKLLTPESFAQEDKKLITLSKQIIETKNSQNLYPLFNELRALYFKDNKYSEFVEFLKSLAQKKKSLEQFSGYYIAEARYQQLKYLEGTQGWDEYFAKGNTYRDQITTGAGNVIASTAPKEPVNIYARLLLWQFHKDQEDAFKDSALDELMGALKQYPEGTTDVSVIKEVADQLLAYGEKVKSRELYKIYVDRLAALNIKDSELEKIAANFYQQANLELAETLYDAYLDRIAKNTPKEKLMPTLIDIAKAFAYKTEGPSDPAYAEKIFRKIEEIGGKDAFNEELIYLRAFNLEKAREYLAAKDIYLELVRRFPNTVYADESNFKVGIIYNYIVRDINNGRSYFEKLAQKETPSPEVISSLYQLGLLAQWQEDLVKARGYYSQLTELAKDGYKETVDLTRERLKEIDGGKPIEAGLKTFLDVCFKDEYAMMEMAKLDLRSNPYKAKKDENVEISSYPFVGESGCFQVEMQYFWSGDVGRTKPSVDEPSFNTTYSDKGTKIINLLVVTPVGVLDRDLNIVDID